MANFNSNIESWMVAYLADLLDILADEVSQTMSFESFGLDSAAIVVMTSDLSKWIGLNLPSDLFFKYPDIQAVAEHLREMQLKPVG